MDHGALYERMATLGREGVACTLVVLVQNAERIYVQVVVTRMMPLGNVTQITEQERAVVAAWVKAGAKID